MMDKIKSFFGGGSSKTVMYLILGLGALWMLKEVMEETNDTIRSIGDVIQSMIPIAVIAGFGLAVIKIFSANNSENNNPIRQETESPANQPQPVYVMGNPPMQSSYTPIRR